MTKKTKTPLLTEVFLNEAGPGSTPLTVDKLIALLQRVPGDAPVYFESGGSETTDDNYKAMTADNLTTVRRGSNLSKRKDDRGQPLPDEYVVLMPEGF